MTKAAPRNHAIALYIGGSSLRQIAAELRVSRSSVERWSARDGWVHQRRAAWDSAVQASSAEVTDRIATQKGLFADRLFGIFQLAIAEQHAFATKKLPRGALRYSCRDLARLAEAVVLAGQAECQAFDRRG